MRKGLLLILPLLFVGCNVLSDPGDLLISSHLVILQNVTAIMSFFLIAIELKWMLKISKDSIVRSLYGFGSLVYALHVFVYYVLITMFRLNIIHLNDELRFLTDWSSVLRFQSIGLLLIVGYQRLGYTKTNKGNHYDTC